MKHPRLDPARFFGEIGGEPVALFRLRHASGTPATLTDDTVLQGGDTLVLSGKAPALALAEDKLLSG